LAVRDAIGRFTGIYEQCRLLASTNNNSPAASQVPFVFTYLTRRYDNSFQSVKSRYFYIYG